MTIKVKLSEIIDHLDFQMEDYQSMVNLKTGEVFSISNENLRKAEEIEYLDGLKDWEKEEMELAIDIFENFDDYVTLPDRFEINEYKMMEDFCYSIENEHLRSKLLRAINGRGAFRRFKDYVLDLDIEDKWYSYRSACYNKLAIEWCETHKISYID